MTQPQPARDPAAVLTAALRRHPYLLLAAACLPFAALNHPNGVDPSLFASLVLLLGVTAFYAYLAFRAFRDCPRSFTVAFVPLCAVYAALSWLLFFPYANPGLSVAATGLCVALALLSYWRTTDRLDTGRIVLLLIIAGVAVRAAYVLLTGHLVRQHDAGGTNGHIPYMEYIYNNLSLPDVTRPAVNQNYHPPLHYLISAAWLKVQTLLAGSEFYACAVENIQILTLFYSSAAMLVSRSLFRLLGLQGRGLVAAMAVVAFHPSFIILAGSVNNDMLSVLFSLLSVLAAVRWYREPTLPRILCVALAVGLGMMTKLSVAMVAPAIAVLFAVKFFQSRAFKRLIGQFAAFAAVCFPLGLWWGVRNLIRTDTPLTYVPDIGKSNIQYLGDYPVWRRLFDVRTPDVWIARGKSYGCDYFDYNIPLTMLKTSVFGEYYIGKNEPLLSVFAYVLSLSNLLLAVAAFVLLLRYVFAKNGFLCGGLRAFFGVLVASMLGMYIKFCFDYPYNCTQDFRYVVPLAVVGALFLGMRLSENRENRSAVSRTVDVVLQAAVVLFCVSSFVLYVSFQP